MGIIDGILDRKSTLRTRDLVLAGLSAGWLDTCAARGARKVAPGLYTRWDRVISTLTIQASKSPALVASMTTALWLQELLPGRPRRDWWVLGYRGRMPAWRTRRAQIVRSRFVDEGTTHVEVDGSLIRVHTPPYATAYCVKFRWHFGLRRVLQAMTSVLEQGAATREELLVAAERMHVLIPMREMLAKTGLGAAGVNRPERDALRECPPRAAVRRTGCSLQSRSCRRSTLWQYGAARFSRFPSEQR